MKARLSLKIDEGLLSEVNSYVTKHNSSISQLVENYFKTLLVSKPTNVLEMIKDLPKPDIDDDLDLKKAFYEERASKYGF